MNILLASDHNGVQLKAFVYNFLKKEGYTPIDLGPYNNDTVDYVDSAIQLGSIIDKGDVQRGILICGTGVGMSIAANRFKNVRAALIFDKYTAEHSIRHNCANFFSLPSKYVEEQNINSIIDSLVNTTFDGGRHMTRMNKKVKIK